MFKNTKAFSGFAVRDIPQAKEFYGKTLGLDIADTPEGGIRLHLAGGAEVFIYEEHGHEPGSFTILYFMVDDIDAAVSQLEKRGIKMERYDNPDFIQTDEKGIARHDTHNIAWFKDPFDNFLAVLQDTAQ